MSWDFRRWQGLGVELCWSLVQVRTHLVHDKPEAVPSLQAWGLFFTWAQSAPSPYLKHLFKHTHPCPLSHWGRRQGTGKKKPFQSLGIVWKSTKQQDIPPGAVELALLWSLQRQRKGYDRGQIQTPDKQSPKGKNPNNLHSTPTQHV